ncbi:MAG: hypothetical protein NTZ18_01145 [Candidatus Komeilibacteria bacterium]|nr:hypothetical protein [Candidatus Komeilibacteria bacterium]
MSEISLKELVGGIAKRSKQTGLSTLEFKKKVEETLRKTPGIGEVQAKKIAEGLRSGTAKLSKEKTIAVLRGLKTNKLLKNVPDVAGEVNRFIKHQADNRESKQEKIKEGILRQNLMIRRRQEVMAKERETEAAKFAKPPEPLTEPRYLEFTPSPLTAEPLPITKAAPINSAPQSNIGNYKNPSEPAAAPVDQGEPEDLPLAA